VLSATEKEKAAELTKFGVMIKEDQNPRRNLRWASRQPQKYSPS
jgi:hypothetical protein